MLHSPEKRKISLGKSLQLLGPHCCNFMCSWWCQAIPTTVYVMWQHQFIQQSFLKLSVCCIHTICLTDTVGIWLCCTGELPFFKNDHSNSLKGWESASHDVLPGNSSSHYYTVTSTQFLSLESYSLYIVSPLSHQYRSCMQTSLTEIYRTQLSSVVHL